MIFNLKRRERRNGCHKITENEGGRNMSQPALEKGTERKDSGFFQRFLNLVEKYGNKLPDIITLFFILTILILIASAIAAFFEWSAINPANGEVITAVNLLSTEGLIQILTNMVSVFIEFPPLGVVLVAMLGVGLAESTGLLLAVIKFAVLKSHRSLIIPMIIFIGVVGNLAGDAVFIALPPIAAVIFISIGMHPLAGIVASYAAAAAGFGANIIINITDVLITGFTQVGIDMVDSSIRVNPSINFYFSFVSTFLIVPIAAFVTKRIIQPRLGTYIGSYKGDVEELTEIEKKGLKWAGIVTGLFVVLLLFMTVPENGMLRDPETGSLIDSPLMDSLIPLILILFIVPSIVYGFIVKSLKSDRDISKHLTDAMSSMAYFILIAFVASQMIAIFDWSYLGSIISIRGAEFLSDLGFTGLPLLLAFIIFSAFVNILIASASAKWALLAPVFVPMFMYMQIDPAVTQAAYRVADSITNAITPMLAYFGILLVTAQKFDKNVKLGTLISLLLPYSIFLGIPWIVLFAVWYLLGLPFGP
jgi:aminobenzoyl-glutamate transport protein